MTRTAVFGVSYASEKYANAWALDMCGQSLSRNLSASRVLPFQAVKQKFAPLLLGLAPEDKPLLLSRFCLLFLINITFIAPNIEISLLHITAVYSNIILTILNIIFTTPNICAILVPLLIHASYS